MSQLLQAYLVRHGETAWSISGQHTGRTDLPLTADGENGARELAPLLRKIRFGRVFVSPRLRARQTCELAGLGQASEIEADLAEWDYGDYEGWRSSDIRKMRPDWNVWRDGVPVGEAPTEVSARADSLITRLCSMHGNIALFTHGQFGAVIAARWIGLPLMDGQHFPLHPASVSILGHEPSHPDIRVIELWNATSSRFWFDPQEHTSIV
ncbi:histidine phosphatase family protein [Paraburkholderia sp. BCC1876]|uniref:histidine phosphatase family protein n=1 Tax=Paraburkholderia sp. BCC1876 TaxID=2676303 RepID=UPI001590B90F|nr:histidine phosphatase family protein [Paraburkholderia sp. BCC1876]